MKLITLLTDFGLKDGFVGVMKGVILSIAPEAQIVDLDHEVEPQNIYRGAFVAGRSVGYFPSGTVHVAVVDPGVGTARRPIAAHVQVKGKEFHLVGPDNGLFTSVYEQAEKEGGRVEVYHLDQPKYWLGEISNVFHGRDIFSPVAAHLVNGVPISALGTHIQNAVRLRLPQAERIPGGVRGQIVAIDTFGNLITNLRRSYLEDLQPRRVCLSGVEIEGLVPTFGSRAPEELIALYDEDGYLMVSVVNGNAQRRLGALAGDFVDVLTD